MDNEMGIVDFRRRGSHYECTTISSIKNISERVNTLSIDLYKMALGKKDYVTLHSIV